MPQVTLSVPHEKLPLLKDVLQSIGIDDKNFKNNNKFSYRKNLSRSVKDSASSFYKKFLSWEYFSNELEFE